MERKVKAPAKPWWRIGLRLLAGFILVVIGGYMGVAWYVHTHNKEVLQKVTASLNEGLSGELTIGGMEPVLFSSFPNVALRLDNVVLRDSLYQQHHRTFLKAGSSEVAVNLAALLYGTIEIRKIKIKEATISLYTGPGGYSNTSVFKKSKSAGGSGNGSLPEVRKLILENVKFIADNKMAGKLYHFDIRKLAAAVDYDNADRTASIALETYAHSMAFSVRKGSFIRNQVVKGTLDIRYSSEKNLIIVNEREMKIGDERFLVGAKIKTGGKTTPFTISIKNNSILWSVAARLLSNNITEKLNMFAIEQPIMVWCRLDGDFDEKGDPLIEVSAVIKDNTVATPGGTIKNCSFNGRFTNKRNASEAKSDANSSIILTRFKGAYSGIPLNMNQVEIANLEHPVAFGDFNSRFKIPQLASVLGDEIIEFKKGEASVRLNYKADVVNYMLQKPFVSGVFKINDAEVYYKPRRLSFKNINASLYMAKDVLSTDSITLQCDKSKVRMKGSAANLLSLYYSSPEKMVVSWDISAPVLHLEDFIGFAGRREKSKLVTKSKKQSGTTSGLDFFFDKCNVKATVRAGKLKYNGFIAENANAQIYVTDDRISLESASLRHAGGLLSLKGTIVPEVHSSRFTIQPIVKNANIKKFFSDFDNFGMTSLTAQNLKGYLNLSGTLSGSLSPTGKILPRSLSGNVKFDVRQGALTDFEPVRNVAKFAFPFRDSKNISFTNLKGMFIINGEKVTIPPMQVNTSVLNMDVEGIYSFGSGTAIAVDVPLRNPAKDKDIKDKEELAERRNRGIVLHLVAADDEDGKVRIKLRKKGRE
jgi:hypothetical protein